MITIADVIDFFGIRRLGRGNENSFAVVCPYCGDDRGKCTVKIIKENHPANVFYCWNCDRSGGMLSLYADLSGKQFDSKKKAFRDMVDVIEGGKSRMQIQEVKQEKTADPKEAKRASDEDIDRTYRELLGCLRLKSTDKKDLIRRGLTEEEISNGLFCSTPYDVFGICRKLIKKGCVLEGVPGFFIARSGEWMLNVKKNAGYFCPVFQYGRIKGMQIRLKEPIGGQKYIWLSSAGKQSGTSSGSPASFYGDPREQTVMITEGILKSYIAYSLIQNDQDVKMAVIGVPGVTAIRDVSDILRKNQHGKVIEAYDMDKRMSMSCNNDYDPEKCADCQGNGHVCRNQDICMKKENKVRKINDAIRNLQRKVPNLVEYNWERDANGLWNGRNKGIDDYLAYLRERRRN